MYVKGEGRTCVVVGEGAGMVVVRSVVMVALQLVALNSAGEESGVRSTSVIAVRENQGMNGEARVTGLCLQVLLCCGWKRLRLRGLQRADCTKVVVEVGEGTCMGKWMGRFKLQCSGSEHGHHPLHDNCTECT